MYIFLVFSSLWAGAAQAALMPQLNKVSLPVADQSAKTEHQALQQAFSETLVRLSGNASIMTLPQVQNVMGDINNYVQSYGFATQQDQQGQSQLMFNVVFDERALKHLLRQADQPIWSDKRPLTLVWLSIDDGKTPDHVLASGNQLDPANQTLQKISNQRGVPFILPAMDLQDQSFLNTSDQQPFDQNKLMAAANRYGVNTLLAADIDQQNNQWQASWVLYVSGQPYQWAGQASDEQTLIQNGLNSAIDILANQYAVGDNQAMQSTVRVAVMGVNDLDDYSKLLSYMRHLSAVSAVQVDDMENAILVLRVTTTMGEMTLAQTLSRSHYLTTIPAPLTEGADNANLYYRWALG